MGKNVSKLIYKQLFMARFKLPHDFVLAVTYNCNSRCRMCNIWKREPLPILDVKEYAKLPNSIREVNITGGEPFLRLELVEIIKILIGKNPKVRIIISSNGFATELIKKQMTEIVKIKPDIGVGLSLDGIGEVHDQVRGIPGGFEKVMQTIKMLKQLGVSNLRLAFTAGDYNIREMNKVYRLARDLGVEFTLAAIHNSENYFNVVENRITKKQEFGEEFTKLIGSELFSASPKRWVRAYFTYALLDFVEKGRRLLPNYSGRDNVFIDPQGDVYPSDVSGHKMGNLNNFNSFEELYNSKEAQEAIELEKENQNWMICTARSAIKRHPLRVFFWILKSKLFGFKFIS